MAQRHAFQDTADRESPKAISSGETHPALVLGLGVNVWVTHVLFALVSGEASPREHVVGACGLLCLLLGVAARMPAPDGTRSDRREHVSRWLLLCAYPASLGLSLSLGSEQVRETAYTALSMPLCAASLLAYGAAAVAACRSPERPLTTESHPLHGREPATQVPPLRRFVIGLCTGGAFLIAVVAPLVPGYAELTDGWGDAAEAGSVLTALVGVAIAVSVIVIHLGGALRKSEPVRETRRQRRQRIATLLFLTVLGFVTYLVVVP